MEAALRTVHHVVTGKNLDGIEYLPVRGMEGIKEATVDLGPGGSVKIAVANGLRNAEELIQRVKSGKADYQFIEVMACPAAVSMAAARRESRIRTSHTPRPARRPCIRSTAPAFTVRVTRIRM